MKIGIIGLGLMGGSLGLELKRANSFASKVVGYNRNKIHNQEALNLGLVDEIVNFEEIKKCDIIFLAIPVDAIIKTLQELKDVSKTTTIIDLGSTKETIIQSLPKEIKENFIPAHPMAGTEFFGPTAAKYGLYENATVVVCDLEEKQKLHKDRALQVFKFLNMKISYMNSSEHDKHAAYISHLPHALSFALANAVMEQENHQNILALSAGGFKDMSRIAKSSPVMWRDIFRHNKTNLLNSIKTYRKQMDKTIEFIENENWEALEEWMKEANKLHTIL